MKKDSLVYVAGHSGLVGSSIIRVLNERGYYNLIYRTRDKLDLCDQQDVCKFIHKEKPEIVFCAAARVGGISANDTYPADFIYENISIQTNIIHFSYLYGVKKLLYLGSACSYPKNCLQPIKEDYLLSGAIEQTNEPYAVAKIAGIKICQAYNKQYGTNFICAIPTNAYGPYDNFHPNDSHVIPSLIMKFHKAKIEMCRFIEIWGSGKPVREFIYVDDLAEACIFLMKNYNSSNIINIGSSEEISIEKLAYLIKDVVGYKGEIVFDESKPDGALRKTLDSSKINRLGWKAKVCLRDGLKRTYKWYLEREKEMLQ